MSKHTEKKTALLGIQFSTATGRLRKLIMFKMVIKLKENFCYRCSKEILSIEEFSIDHKLAWQSSENPVDTFFDLNNIAFSHHKCNVDAAVYPKKYETKKEYIREMLNRANNRRRENYNPEIRREYYTRTGW